MSRCCRKFEDSFFIRKILPIIVILFNVSLTTYFIVSNAQNYDKYKNRPTYIIYPVFNTTSSYYIIRGDLNDTSQCSRDSLFTFDVTTVYKNIISKEGVHNILFITVYWLNTIVAILLSLFDIVMSSVRFFRKDHDEYDSLEPTVPFLYKLISSIGSQCLRKGSFLFPTYFIGIFDYTQLCLSHHTEASLFLLHHTYIGIFISLFGMIYLLLWTWACWDSEVHYYKSNMRWLKCIDILTCRNRTANIIICVCLCLVIVPIGIYGIFVWVTSLMEFLLTTKAVLICFNFFFGLIHELTHLCRH